jgi:hypothetical protein
MKHLACSTILTGVFALGWGQLAEANPVWIGPALGIPSPPVLIPGKEYADEIDVDANGAIDSLQTIRWTGTGTVANGPDGNNPPGAPPDGSASPMNQLDALSNSWDALFFAVVTNNTAVLFSTRDAAAPQNGSAMDLGAPMQGCAPGAPICYETVKGTIGTWATGPVVNAQGVTNLDALEVGGYQQVADANRGSLFSDVTTGVSVWTGGANPYVLQSEIAALFPGIPVALIDIDAMMTYDLSRWLEDGSFDVGDWLMFSLWPIPGYGIVGDEVWVWEKGGGFAYLNHGGHLWDSGWLGYNIDALEAGGHYYGPVPATLPLLLGGTAILIGLRRRTRVRKRGQIPVL